MNKIIAFFDFDGTITKRDSLIDFIKYYFGRLSYYKGILILSPMLLAYKLKIISNHSAKEKLISHFFKGLNSIHFQNIANMYSLEQMDKIIRHEALDKIKWHKEKGHKIVIVSASMECWLSAWCKKNKLELIATKLEIKNNRLTGKFSSKNCYGVEKVNRIMENYNLKDFETIYAYGDSIGDRQMLEIADKKYYKCF